jgi:hypothetical protein
MTRPVTGTVNYIADMTQRPRYYANDHSRDVLALDPRQILIEDVRGREPRPSLGREGYELLAHRSEVRDFRNKEEVAAIHPGEIERLLLDVSGADRVVVNGTGVLRFGEKSPEAGKHDNSMPARFIHVDVSDATAREFAARSQPHDAARQVRRFAHYNVWRALSPPPQDVPLTVCDARSLGPDDFVAADAVFDVPGKPEWLFEAWLVRYNPAHRWAYFSSMHRDEVLVFKTNDSDKEEAHCVPHCAFDDATCPEGVTPRSSIEMRGVAYWYA